MFAGSTREARTVEDVVSGGNLGATSASRGVQSQAGSWGTGLPPNSDVGERLGY